MYVVGYSRKYQSSQTKKGKHSLNHVIKFDQNLLEKEKMRKQFKILISIQLTVNKKRTL